MDDATFVGLRAALQATPDNVSLRGVLIDACWTRADLNVGQSLLVDTDAKRLPATHHHAAAAIWFALGDPGAARPYLLGEDGPTLVLRARVLLALHRTDDAAAAYAQALALNPALEDGALSVALAQSETDDAGGPLRRLAAGGPGSDRVDDVTVHAVPSITFADVGGLQTIKDRIRKRVILPMQKPSLFKRFRRKAGGGVLLYGPPGCGKTLMARATAGETGAHFIEVKISDVLDMWIGASEQKLHALFEMARANKPSVLFFDEVEALGGRRQHGRGDASVKVVSQFLAEMDGVDANNDGVLVLAATNVPWSVDPAFRRPGRFDRVVFVAPPDREARVAILGIHLADRPIDTDVDIDKIARKTSGYSGADLQHVVETAADLAIDETLERGTEVPIGAHHLVNALDEVKPTTLEWLTSARNHARYANEGGQYDDVLAFLKTHGKR